MPDRSGHDPSGPGRKYVLEVYRIAHPPPERKVPGSIPGEGTTILDGKLTVSRWLYKPLSAPDRGEAGVRLPYRPPAGGDDMHLRDDLILPVVRSIKNAVELFADDDDRMGVEVKIDEHM